MNSEQLKYFISVAKHLNFTEAAKEFYLTQPAISHQISALERELGTRLFVRSTRNVTLTKSGELFLEDAKQFLSLESSWKNRIRLADSSEELSLTIAFLLSPCRQFLPTLLHFYHRKYPQVTIRLFRMNAQEISDSIKKQEYDLYLSMQSDLQQQESYACRQLFQDSFCLVCRNDHPCVSDLPIDYNKIASEPFLMNNPKKAPLLEKQVLQACRELHFVPRVTQYLDSIEDILFAVECGLGISILPYKTRDYGASALAYIPLDTSIRISSIGIAWKYDIENQAVSWFLEMLAEMQQEQPELF